MTATTDRTIETGDGTTLRIRTDGPADAPPLLLCNSLGTDHTMWDPQIPLWADDRFIIRFDHRGSVDHGAGVPAPPYTLDQLGGDAVAVLDALEVGTTDVCGISLGGLVAQWVAVHHPHRVRGLALADTDCRIGSAEGWEARQAAVREQGMDGIADLVLGRFFSPAFLGSGSPHLAATRAMVTATPTDGYLGACGALAAGDLTDAVGAITAPVLVVVGSEDQATTAEAARALTDRFADARMLVIDGAGHLPNLEQPEVFATAVSDFLA